LANDIVEDAQFLEKFRKNFESIYLKGFKDGIKLFIDINADEAGQLAFRLPSRG
jgi:hypothetical protein